MSMIEYVATDRLLIFAAETVKKPVLQRVKVLTNLNSIRVFAICQDIKQIFIAQEVKSCKHQSLCLEVVLQKTTTQTYR